MSERVERAEREGYEPATFVTRVLVVVTLATLACAAVLLFWQAVGVLVLLFAGVLLGIVLRGAAEWLSRQTSLSPTWGLALVLVCLVAVLGAVGVFLGSEVASQFEEFVQLLPDSLKQLQTNLQQRNLWPADLPLPSATTLLSRINVVEPLTGVFSVLLSIPLNILIVLIIGIYVAAQPQRYRAGLLYLAPPTYRERLGEVLDALGATLQRWMGGQLLDMALVGLLTTTGLYLLGIPAPLALGLLTALIVFIPYLGPLLSLGPALLVALTQGAGPALNVVFLYAGIQLVESYLLQPLIMDNRVDLPPAVVIGSQLFLGVLLGPLGIMFATPLVAAAQVIIKMLYVNDILGEQVQVVGVAPSTDSRGARSSGCEWCDHSEVT